MPAPSQARAGVSVPPEHDAAAHTLPAGQSRHAPARHVPSVPQVDAAFAAQRPRGSAVPSVTVPQAPSAPPVSAAEQAWQAPAHAVPQQKPSTQKPLAHWSPAVQAAATPCSGTQAPPAQ